MINRNIADIKTINRHDSSKRITQEDTFQNPPSMKLASKSNVHGFGLPRMTPQSISGKKNIKSNKNAQLIDNFDFAGRYRIYFQISKNQKDGSTMSKSNQDSRKNDRNSSKSENLNSGAKISSVSSAAEISQASPTVRRSQKQDSHKFKRDLTPLPIFDKNGNVASYSKNIQHQKQNARRDSKISMRRRILSSNSSGNFSRTDSMSSTGSRNTWNTMSSDSQSSLVSGFSTMSSQTNFSGAGSFYHSGSNTTIFGLNHNVSSQATFNDSLVSGSSKLSVKSASSKHYDTRDAHRINGNGGNFQEKPLYKTTLAPNQHVGLHIKQIWAAFSLQQKLVNDFSKIGNIEVSIVNGTEKGTSDSARNTSSEYVKDHIDGTLFSKIQLFQ